MAGEIGNPLGYVPLFDGGDPRIISGHTEAVVSGGAPVYASGAAGNVGSNTESYAESDVIFLTGASGLLFNGVATATAGSNTTVSVATAGVIIGKAAGTITAGKAVGVNAGGFLDSAAAGYKVGRAISSCASGNFALIQITP